ncbi:protein GrpE-like [Mangifera indica]|uniref:protein GrpE-like n=1 Tax=Mangifera indica TaxID=29780 RepID=UPI001CFB41C2|nr:protein GrpE-like [Mangifera indica]
MATIIKTPPFHAPPTLLPSPSAKSTKAFCLSFRQQHRSTTATTRVFSRTAHLCFSAIPSLRLVKFAPLASSGETETTQTEEEIEEPEVVDSSDGSVGVEDATGVDDTTVAEETHTSVINELLQSYKEALTNNDDSRVAEIEDYLKSIDGEKVNLESKVAQLSEELSVEKDRILRISADFDNFRKRTERERSSLVSNAQGEVVERLLLVLDNFERAKTQIKVETEGEEKINNSYQSIYKQLVEILGSFGVAPVETIGKPFDPLLHEAIMREDSSEFEEGIIIGEFRKGFKLGDRLLRPSMVKVSAGPGPAKLDVEPPGGEDSSEITENNTAEVEAESS